MATTLSMALVQRATQHATRHLSDIRLHCAAQLGLGFRVQGSGFRVQGLGFRVQRTAGASPAAHEHTGESIHSVCLCAPQRIGRLRRAH